MVALHLHTPELRNLTDVVAAKVHQHVVLGQLLLIRKEPRLQCLIFLQSLATRPRARQREGVELTVLELDQSLRRSPRHLHIRSCKIEHVRRRIQRPQHAVAIQKTPLIAALQTVRKHDLKDVAFLNMVLRRAHHLAVALLIK